MSRKNVWLWHCSAETTAQDQSADWAADTRITSLPDTKLLNITEGNNETLSIYDISLLSVRFSSKDATPAKLRLDVWPLL